jgi:signal transduction histidine kinase
VPEYATARQKFLDPLGEFGDSRGFFGRLTEATWPAEVSMVAAPAAQLLIVNADPDLAKLIGARLQSVSPRYRLIEANSRESFVESLGRDRPDLVVVDEVGIPDVPMLEVLAQSRRLDAAIPVVVIASSQGEHSWARTSPDELLIYLRVTEIDRLPSVVERSLCEQRAAIARARLQDEIERVAGLMQENQRLVTIGRLAGSIAHEINNPLESVTNLLFLMNQAPDLSADVRKYLVQAQRELSRAVEISKQTLNFYREAPNPISVKLSSLLEEVLILYARRIAEKKLEVIRKFEREESIVAFPGEMRQVFSNLIANAIEASTQGGKLCLHVHKSALWRESGKTGMRVTIADTGTGMTPEIRRRLGEPFFTTKGQGGTGLGLWVSRSIIHRYGGSLTLRSSTRTRHGTVFSLFIPTNLRPHAVTNPGDQKSALLGSERQVKDSVNRPHPPRRRKA